MKRDVATQAGIVFTLLVAVATLAVAVIAGLFLIFEPGVNGLNARYGMHAFAQASTTIINARPNHIAIGRR